MKTEGAIKYSHGLKRRHLLPWWIKLFTWFFLALQVISILYFISFLLGYIFLGLESLKFDLAIYGLETEDPASFTGFLILFFLQLKGVTAFGLWTGKKWAINLGIADSLIGIAFCLFIMVIYPFVFTPEAPDFNFRFELLLLVPYFSKLRKIKSSWENFNISYNRI